MGALAPEEKCPESTSTAFPHAAKKRRKQVSPACRAAARLLGSDLDPQPGSTRPVEFELGASKSGKAVRLVGGAYGELPGAIFDITDMLAS